jgi:CubicO group peptidase (beta-lactamase class C family)
VTVKARIDPAALDALLAPYDSTHGPGFALGVALAGVPRYRKGVGLANVELPVALSPSIRMRIGSTTKHFCVLAVMLLAEEGRLSIDDSPRAVIPELPRWADAITLRQLMAHTSGMRDSLDLFFLTAGPGRPGPADAQLKLLAALDSVNFAPGASWNYNNGGYVLLSVIVERISGQSLEDFLRTRIFEPIGMADTRLRRLDTDLCPNSATLHLPTPGGGWTRGVFGLPIAGEGGIVSTVDDMLRWLAHMSAPIVGRRSTWDEMRTPVTTHGYGLGLNMTEHRGLRTVHHAGGVVGGSSQMLKVLDHELDLILMTNGQSALDLYGLVDAVLDACFEGLPPVPKDAGGVPITGAFYSSKSGQVLTLSEHEGGQAMTIGGYTLPARRDAAGQISVGILPTDLRVKPIAGQARVDALLVTEFGATDRLDRVEASCEAKAPIGYFDASAGLSARITDGPGGARMSLASSLGASLYKLEPLGPGLWRGLGEAAMPLALTLEVDETGFALTSGRTVRLCFERRR